MAEQRLMRRQVITPDSFGGDVPAGMDVLPLFHEVAEELKAEGAAVFVATGYSFGGTRHITIADQVSS